MILVTGSTGFIGRSLMNRLQSLTLPVKSYKGRINDPMSLRAELFDVEVLIHLAGAESRDRVRLLKHVDVEGTARLLEECRLAGVKHLILASRLNSDPNSVHALLRAKGEQERLIRQSGVPYTIVRSATLFGLNDRFLNVIAGLAAWTWPFVWLPGSGRVAMQPLWVEDLVQCLVACLDRPDLQNETIEIAGAERFRYADIVRLVLRAGGIRRRPLNISLKLIRPLSALFFGWRIHPPVTRFFLDRFTVPEVAPLDSVRGTFNFRPAQMARHMAYLRRPGHRWRLLSSG